MTIRKTTLILSIISFIISLLLTGFTDDRNGANSGMFLVFFGALQLFSGGASLTWLANPILWFSWRTSKLKASFVGSVLSTILALSFSLFDIIQDGGTCAGTDYQVNSCDTIIKSHGLGYYFWVLSSFILLVGNTIRLFSLPLSMSTLRFIVKAKKFYKSELPTRR